VASELERVSGLVAPIASDLELDVYDVERRGGTIRVTLDTPPGSDEGINLDTLALATRLISRELDHQDPINGRYTLEVTSPGLERPLRTPAHFQREVGKDVQIRLRDVSGDDRRIRGVLESADDTSAAVRTENGEQRVVDYSTIDKARTVFEWGPKPKAGTKPGQGKRKKKKSGRGAKDGGGGAAGESGGKSGNGTTEKEKQPS
jgi:ribosome maturation factor RimP